MQKYKTVEEFLNGLADDKRLQVKTLRSLILKTEPRLEERIKWNSPSYALNGQDRITFNLLNKQDSVKLVLHMGATRKENKNGKPVMQDTSGILEWISDIRCIASFDNINDVNAKLPQLKNIIKEWLLLPT